MAPSRIVLASEYTHKRALEPAILGVARVETAAAGCAEKEEEGTGWAAARLSAAMGLAVMGLAVEAGVSRASRRRSCLHLFRLWHGSTQNSSRKDHKGRTSRRGWGSCSKSRHCKTRTAERRRCHE